MADWYYAKDDRQCGPVSQDALCQMAAAGQLAADNLVWTDSMKDWAPASEVPGLLAPAGAAPATHTPKKRSSSGWDRLSDGAKVGIMVLIGGGLVILLFVVGLGLMSDEPPSPARAGRGHSSAGAETQPKKQESEEPVLRAIAFDPKYLQTEKDKEFFERGRKEGEHFADLLVRQLGDKASPQQTQQAVDEEMQSRHVAVQAAVASEGPRCIDALLAFGRREGFKSGVARLHLPTPANLKK